MPFTDAYQAAPNHNQLGDDFFDRVKAAAFPEHILRFRNQGWATRLGLGALSSAEWIEHLGRFTPLPDNFEAPLALRYHGHQFRHYNPDLGDGRGFLYAQLRDPKDGRLLDLGTKGSGQTPYSRGGDGRLTLKGGVREILATEQLEALGVNTSKTFSLIETGEALVRHDEPSPTRACVLVRLNHSHIRFGSFQRCAYHREPENIQKLLDYAIEHYFPHLADPSTRGDALDTPAAFLAEVATRSAKLCAQWTVAGFLHGVLNTDNMNITGESFDYGPFRFAPTCDPNFTAAYFDDTGLYAYGRQPDAVFWNLQQLALALRPLSNTESIVAALRNYMPTLDAAIAHHLCKRLGLKSQGPEKDATLMEFCFDFLEQSKIPFDQFFFDWYGGGLSTDRASASPEAARYKESRFEPVRAQFNDYEAGQPERLSHAYFQQTTPCSMLIDEIEALWAHIDKDDNWQPLEHKIKEVREMGTALGLAQSGAEAED